MDLKITALCDFPLWLPGSQNRIPDLEIIIKDKVIIKLTIIIMNLFYLRQDLHSV